MVPIVLKLYKLTRIFNFYRKFYLINLIHDHSP
jgi:hypothetical protein